MAACIFRSRSKAASSAVQLDLFTDYAAEEEKQKACLLYTSRCDAFVKQHRGYIKGIVDYHRWHAEINMFLPFAEFDDTEMCIRDRMKQDYDVVQLSATMGTNINLMLIKLNELNRMGWQLNLPYVPHSDFLKNVRPEG